MRVEMTLTIPKDFELLCLALSVEPAEALQNYINRISIARHLINYPINSLGIDMSLMLRSESSLDPQPLNMDLKEVLINDFSFEVKEIVGANNDRLLIEYLLDELVKTWVLKLFILRVGYRSKSNHKFTITGYDN